MISCHPTDNSHPSWRIILWTIAGLGMFFLASWLLPLPLPFEKLAQYLPFHILLEILSVIASALIFTIGWQTCRANNTLHIALLSCAFLGIGILDTGHLMTHTGMPLYAFIQNPAVSPAFWLAARLLAAIALLAAFYFQLLPQSAHHMPQKFMAASLGYTAIIGSFILFLPHWLPDIYVAGAKLTTFRLIAEYSFILLHVAAAMLLLLTLGNRLEDNEYSRYMLLGIISLVLSETSIAMHGTTTGALNLGGHIFKVAAYYFIYRGVFACSVKSPFDMLQHAQNRVIIQRELAEITLKSIGDAVITTDFDGTIIFMNPVAENLTAWKQQEATGKPLDKVFHIINQLSRSPVPNPAYHAVRNSCIVTDDPNNHATLISHDNKEYSIEYTASPIRNAEGFVLGCVLVFHDITEKFQLLEQMSWQAGHDTLTHLPNRTLLSDRIGQAIAQANRQEHLLLICFMDLDGFKAVNDQHGHETGDKLLIEVARRLINAVRSEDTVSRLGGDEFVLLLNQIHTMDEVDALLSRILDEMARPYTVGNATLKVSASIGATIFPFDSSDTDTLLRHADQAMYQAKQGGRNRFHLFDASMDLQLQEHHLQLTRLEKAIANQELVLYYQPKVNLKKNEVFGMEALLRWQHPEQGLLPPMEFLHLAEESSLIVEIGDWVLQEALRQLSHWHQAGHDWSISVNIAPKQLQRLDFIENIRGILAQFPDAPTCKLELEILDSSALADMNHVRNIILACQEMGIRISLDDFGSGYSSLAYLRHLPVNTLKIDQSFVRDMLDDEEDKALVDGILQMARVFKREVIAEGMETAAHGALLLNLGCNLAQGNGIGRAMPAQEVPDWAAQFKPDPRWQNYPAALIGWGRISSETTKSQTELSL